MGGDGRPRPLRAFGRAALGGSIGLGERYAGGHWDVADLLGLLRRLHRWARPLRAAGSLWANAVEPLRSAGSAAVPMVVDQRNVAYHYDLPPKWFALVLDPGMSYSCASYESEDEPLATAAARKIDQLCARLRLTPSSHLLDIGAGWGSLAFAAAGRCGARVTGTTLSTRQFDAMRAQLAQVPWGDRVRIRCDHYRHLTGTYDAIASIEMIEALDWRRHRDVLAVGRRLLDRRGVFVLQAITIDDRHYHRTKRNVEFIKRFVFPGGCLPSLRALERDAATVGFDVAEVVVMSASYGPTLAAWRHNLERNWDAARALGLSESFLRMWRFYFAYCEAGFREGYLGDHQLVLQHSSTGP